MNKLPRLLLVFTSLSAFFLLSFNPVLASPIVQQNKTFVVPDSPPAVGINLNINPIFLNLTTDPGVPVSSQLKITNNNNFKEYLQLSLAKFDANENGDQPVLKDITSSDDFAKWINFSEDHFVVDINEQKTINFTVSPPKDAALGYYYAIMVKRIKERNSTDKNQTVVTGAPAFLVILEVRSPNAKKEVKLVDFKTDSLFYEYLPAKFDIKFQNTGNIHMVPYGNIFIDWGTEKNVGIILANQTRGNILPGTTRTYQSFWDDGFISILPKVENGVTVRDQQNNIVYETKIDWSKLTKFRIGKYTAHLLAVYDNGQRDVPLEASVTFWIIPWKIILGASLLLAFIGLGIKSSLSSALKKVKR